MLVISSEDASLSIRITETAITVARAITPKLTPCPYQSKPAPPWELRWNYGGNYGDSALNAQTPNTPLLNRQQSRGHQTRCPLLALSPPLIP